MIGLLGLAFIACRCCGSRGGCGCDNRRRNCGCRQDGCCRRVCRCECRPRPRPIPCNDCDRGGHGGGHGGRQELRDGGDGRHDCDGWASETCFHDGGVRTSRTEIEHHEHEGGCGCGCGGE
ncbi:MAG: hypothetical protein FWE13_06455 [Firmicutes bacterium]|nr:hypothetical protein [Bacillota bacterium]